MHLKSIIIGARVHLPLSLSKNKKTLSIQDKIVGPNIILYIKFLFSGIFPLMQALKLNSCRETSLPVIQSMHPYKHLLRFRD